MTDPRAAAAVPGTGGRVTPRRYPALVSAILSNRFGEAAAWASELHNDHLRKGTAIPYVSHLFAVASLVLEDGGSEDEAIAALLHDAVEDDKTTLDEIGARYGAAVAAMVDACSDTIETPKPPWRGRKAGYIAHLYDPHTPEGALRVSAADKVHNARCVLADYKAIGDELWLRFNPDAQSADAQLWYYEALVEAFAQRRPESRLTEELDRIVSELREAVAYAQRPASCPACRADTVVPIAYGFPGTEMLEASGRGEIALGGCEVSDDSPAWRCRACDHTFDALSAER
jgi:hypothetical protein